MRMAQPIVKLPPTERMVAAGIGGYKSPRLEEAYLHFFAKEMENAHDALADVLARKDIYFAMQELADE
jgi:DNA polymerase-3 subunit epsilon